MGPIERCYIALGSNVGDRRKMIDEAITRLSQMDIRVTKRSTVLETKPIGPIVNQPDFLNCVVEVETALPPLDLLERLLAIELQLGRVRQERWGPRTIDLDLLLYGNQTIHEPRLTVPHPEIEKRPFVRSGLDELKHE